jgi:hypothetical protein
VSSVRTVSTNRSAKQFARGHYDNVWLWAVHGNKHTCSDCVHAEDLAEATAQVR